MSEKPMLAINLNLSACRESQPLLLSVLQTFLDQIDHHRQHDKQIANVVTDSFERLVGTAGNIACEAGIQVMMSYNKGEMTIIFTHCGHVEPVTQRIELPNTQSAFSKSVADWLGHTEKRRIYPQLDSFKYWRNGNTSQLTLMKRLERSVTA